MVDQSILENISATIEKILGSGLAVNGQISVNGLTITSVDKAKNLGIIPHQSQQQGQQEGQSGQSGKSGQNQSSGQQGGQGQQAQPQEQVSREEFDSLREEIRYLRQLMESSRQEPQEQPRKSTPPK